MLAVAVVGFVVFLVLSKERVWFRKGVSSLVLKVPLVGDIVGKIYLAQFANTMWLLVSTDTPLLRSIALLRQMIGFYLIETSLEEVEKATMGGDSLHSSLAKFPFYPAKWCR